MPCKQFQFVVLVQLCFLLVSGSSNFLLPASLSLELSTVPAVDQCKVLLEKFSNSSSMFTRCATQYAKPIFMCRYCVHDYIDVRTYYYALEHAQSEGINCKDLLTSQDKVEIIRATFDYIVADKGLWAKGFCSSCYTSPLNHTSKLTNNTDTFFALFRSVNDCFQAHPNNNRTETKKSEACSKCFNDYNNLSKFYKENFLRDQFPYLDGICFDILDAMNSTQHRWGTGHYNCGVQLTGNLPLILAILVVLVTPIAFYVLVRWGPGTRRAQERVLTQRHIRNFISQAQEDNTDGAQEESNGSQGGSDGTQEEPIPGPSS
eukprot:GFUD01018953.1.p1 GENE.GFUD01018953.1~~GFUD01018953.1.p1  ORF type:complete len:318 (-),score=81.42 GFUD01018953.1:98-1051(-)